MMISSKYENTGKYEITEDQLEYILDHLDEDNIGGLTLHLRKFRTQKEYGIFDKADMYYLNRDNKIEIDDLKKFANKILILTKESMMVPRTVFELTKPQKTLNKIQLNTIQNLNNDIFGVIIACIRLHQSHIKKYNFQNSKLDQTSGLLFKYLFCGDIGNTPNVYHLNLNNNNLGDEGAGHLFSALKKCRENNVRIIRLNHNNLSSIFSLKLASILQRKKGRLPPVKLQVLTLKGNKIGNMGIENISNVLRKNNTLKYLDISFCGLDGTALEILQQDLGENQCLRVLNLLGNSFGMVSEEKMSTKLGL